MDDNARFTLIAAAAAGIGTVESVGDYDLWKIQVADLALTLATDFDDRSLLARTLDVIARAKDPDDKSASMIPVTITSVVKEQSSSRGVVTYEATSKRAGGQVVEESVRTDFTQKWDSKTKSFSDEKNPDGNVVAKKASTLVGNRALIFFEREPKADGSGETVRVLRHLIDLGEA